MNQDVTIERIDALVAYLDSQIAAGVDALIHHPSFQELEAAWRGLAFVVDRVAPEANIELAVWSLSKPELQEDFEEAVDVTASRAYRTIYTAEYGQFGGRPYGAVFVNAAFSGSAQDVALLRRLAAVGAMAHAPVFVGADPKLLRVERFADLAMATELAATFEDPTAATWNAFRAAEDSRYVGVLLPRLLLRRAYRESDESATRFVYDERIRNAEDRLWGSPTFAFAVRIADSFARTRAYAHVLGTFEDRPPVRDEHPALGPMHAKPPVEVLLSRRLEQTLSELGFIPLTSDPVGSTLRFTTANSAQRPREFGSAEGGEVATLNFLLGARIPYLLLACRFAHYLKVLERERIGAHRTREEIERELNDWLAQYVVVMDNASATTRLKYPLRNARVTVTAVDGNADLYRMEVFVVPHMKYMRQAFTLSVAGRLETR
jgi:type VI secretion system protein ImpC